MKQKEAVERLGDGFHNLSQGVADLNVAMNKAGQECLNTLLKNLPSEITNYHCPDCGCNLLFDHILNFQSMLNTYQNMPLLLLLFF